jgi:glycosyltransferase 2 family protein
VPNRAQVLAAGRALLGSPVLRWGFLLAVLVGGVGYVRGLEGLGAALCQLGVAPVAGGLLAVLVGLAASMLAWRALLADLGSALPVAVAARIFFVGQLGKYIPGSLWPVLAQMEMGKEAGVPRQCSATAITLPMLIYLGTGLLLGGAALPFASTEAARYRWVVALAPALLLVLHPRLLNPVVRRLTALARRPAPERELSGRGVLAAFGWSVVSWAAFGVQVQLLVLALGAPLGRSFPLAVGGFALAWSAGFLVVVAPAGIGAREAVLVALLAPVLDRAEATAASLVARLLMTAGDVVLAGAAVAAWRTHRSSAPVGGAAPR